MKDIAKGFIDKKVAGGMRRSESFHHGSSIGDFNGDSTTSLMRKNELEKLELFRPGKGKRGPTEEDNRRPRGKSAERLVQDPPPKSLIKSKSMEFLKARLLSKKSRPRTPPTEWHDRDGTAAAPQPYDSMGTPPGLWGFRHIVSMADKRSSHRRSKDQYDWRQVRHHSSRIVLTHTDGTWQSQFFPFRTPHSGRSKAAGQGL